MLIFKKRLLVCAPSEILFLQPWTKVIQHTHINTITLFNVILNALECLIDGGGASIVGQVWGIREI